MNGKLIVVVFVVLVLGYVFSQSPNPTPDVLANDYATTIAALATVAAYESLSVPKEVVSDPVVEEVVQEVAEQMELLEPVQEVVTIPVSQTVVPVETESFEETTLDDAENVAWEKLNDMREKAGLKRLSFTSDLLGGCRQHAKEQHKKRTLWRTSSNESCAICPSGESPIQVWKGNNSCRAVLLSHKIDEGSIARSGNYWVFRARPAVKTVTITEDTGNVEDIDTVEVKEKVVRKGSDSYTTSYASDGQRTVKTYTRKGKVRPLRYALWRAFH
jgi:hypothetical protein